MTSVYPANAPRQLPLPASTTAGMDPILLNLPMLEVGLDKRLQEGLHRTAVTHISLHWCTVLEVCVAAILLFPAC